MWKKCNKRSIFFYLETQNLEVYQLLKLTKTDLESSPHIVMSKRDRESNQEKKQRISQGAMEKSPM